MMGGGGYGSGGGRGGWQRMGRQKGNAPRDQQKQNKQFEDAVKAAERQTGKRLSSSQQRQLHDEISGRGFGFHDIVEAVLEMLK